MDNIDQNKIDITEIDLVDLDEMPEDTTPEQTDAEDFSDDFDHAEIDAPEVDLNDVDIDLDIPDCHSEQSDSPYCHSERSDSPYCHSERSEESPGKETETTEDETTDIVISSEVERSPNAEQTETPEVDLNDVDIDLDVPDVTLDSPEVDVVDDLDLDLPDLDLPEDTETPDCHSEQSDSPYCHSERSEESPGKETETSEDAPTEEEGSDEKAIPEEDLEAYRDIQSVTADSEMVDLTGFKARSRAKDEKEAAKKKKSKKPAFDLFAHRTKNKSINARIAAAEPILYFYNAVLDKKGSVLFINVYQVLQDRFMGKVVPHQYTAVAEGSGRIEELNTICVQEVVKQCNQFPDYKFAVQISSRFFTKPNVLEKLVNQAQTENNNLIFAFDAVSLQNIGIAAKTGLAMLKNRGISVLLDNAELISMNLLTELDYDIIRVDSRYYEREGEKTYSYLQFLIKFAHEIGITTCATFCDEDKIADYMLENGIDGVQGCAVSNPVRTVPNTIKAITLLDSMVNYHEEDLDFYHQQELAQTDEIGATSGRR